MVEAPVAIDQWRVAHSLMRLYGQNAKIQAVLRSERAQLNGDFMKYKTWKEIGSKVLALRTGAYQRSV
jgi:hypothetical protein